MTERLELRYLDPTSLTPQPNNPWSHPPVQREALAGTLDAAGWAGAALLNLATGRLIDGHLRREEALRRGESLPTLCGSWSEAQERLLLAAVNPIGMLARQDDDLLADLHAQLAADLDAGLLSPDARLDALLGDLTSEPFPDEPPPLEGLTRADVPDALFATDNEWQVPLLDARLQADSVDLPVVTWGSVARTSRMRGTWHFYTGDYRYRTLWDDPSPVVNSGCINAVEPNFSIYGQTPRAVALYRIYQKRWVARWWQSQGRRVFVDLNVAEAHADLNLLGVPQGWRAYATRGYTERMDATEREWALACQRAGSEDGLLFLVYGGGKQVAELCGRRGWVHVDEHMNRKGEAQEPEADGEE